MGNLFDKNAEIRISLSGLISIVALFALYGLSCVVPARVQIYNSEFWGIAAILLCSMAVSAIWLLLYWLLDRLQRENVSAVATTFFASAFVHIVCQNLFSWITGSFDASPLQHIFIPMVSFFAVFCFCIIRLKTFDEYVDSFIYGAFAGTGIGFASCVMDFVTYDSVSFKFVAFELVTRISVYAAICSLCGYLLHQALLKKNLLKHVVAIVLLALLLAIDVFVERAFSRNLSFASKNIIPLLISFCFVVVQIVVVVILIHVALKHPENSAPVSNEAIKTPAKTAAVLFALAFLCAFGIRASLCKTEKFTANDGKYAFQLPAGYQKCQDAANGGIFDLPSSENAEYFSNGSEMIYFYFDTDSSALKSLGDPSYYLYKWGVTEEKRVSASQNENGETEVVFQTTFVLRNGEKNFVVDAYSSSQNDAEVKEAVRVIAKTMEKSNE